MSEILCDLGRYLLRIYSFEIDLIQNTNTSGLGENFGMLLQKMFFQKILRLFQNYAYNCNHYQLFPGKPDSDFNFSCGSADPEFQRTHRGRHGRAAPSGVDGAELGAQRHLRDVLGGRCRKLAMLFNNLHRNGYQSNLLQQITSYGVAVWCKKRHFLSKRGRLQSLFRRTDIKSITINIKNWVAW